MANEGQEGMDVLRTIYNLKDESKRWRNRFWASAGLNTGLIVGVLIYRLSL